MHLHERAAQIEQAGRLPLPSREYANVADYDDATHILIRLGLQPASGRYLYMADLDTHHAGQNAARALADFRQVEPTIAGKFAICPSTNKGYHCFFESYSPLEGGKLYDADGRHIGELITDRTLDPGDIAPG